MRIVPATVACLFAAVLPGLQPHSAAQSAPPATAMEVQGAWSIVDSPNSRPTRTNNFSFGATCPSESECWAVGYYDHTVAVVQTLIERWDGASWAIVPSPNTSPTQSNLLRSVTCASASECWAVGSYDNGGFSQTLVERWDGASWTIVPSPNSSDTQHNSLSSVTCAPGGSPCWAVGSYNDGSAYRTLVERWDGTAWTIVPSPNTGSAVENLLDGVSCASASDCWAVGHSVNAVTGFFQTLIERWDGSSWSIVTSPNALASTNNDLLGVTCVSGSQCWAAGYAHNGLADQTLVLRWDGTSWTVVGSPNTLLTQENHLRDVTCASGSECWAVGHSNPGAAEQTLIARWDGVSWTIAPSPGTGASQSSSLFGAACASTGCWAVGESTSDGVAQSLIERWNGTAWTVVNSPSVNAPQNNTLVGVTCASATDCWAVASYYDGHVQQALIERWDGASWTIVPSPSTSATESNLLYDVACPSASDCWAVGYASTPGGWQTLIERWDGSSWSIVPSPSTGATQNNFLTDVTCVSGSDCWAVGYYDSGMAYQTLVAHWDGSSWTILPSANTDAAQENRLFGATCVTTSSCWAVGRWFNGTQLRTLIEHWDGSAWTIVTSADIGDTPENALEAVTCASASDCWAVGSSGAGGTGRTLIERWDGASWTITGSPNPPAPNDYEFLRGVTCAAPAECWAVGFSFIGGAYRTLIERWDGTSWAIAASPNTSATQYNFLIDVTCVPASGCWAAGYHYDDSGIIQTLVLRNADDASSGAGTVPDRSGPNGQTPLLIVKAAGGDLLLSWSPSCASTDTDYTVYEGTIGGTFDNHASRLCSTSGATTATLAPSGGSRYFLVSPRNAGREGSLGRRSDGAERPQGTTICLPREIAACP